MSIKTSFMPYMKWTRVSLPVVFDEFELVCLFFLLLFSLSFSSSKRSTLAKIWGLQPPFKPPVSIGLHLEIVALIQNPKSRKSRLVMGKV